MSSLLRINALGEDGCGALSAVRRSRTSNSHRDLNLNLPTQPDGLFAHANGCAASQCGRSRIPRIGPVGMPWILLWTTSREKGANSDPPRASSRQFGKFSYACVNCDT
jgi:hypothetical protein